MTGAWISVTSLIFSMVKAVSRLPQELTRDTLTHEPRLEVAREVTPEPALLNTAALRFSFWNLFIKTYHHHSDCS